MIYDLDNEPRARSRRSSWTLLQGGKRVRLSTTLLLAAIVIVGSAFRLVNIADWDERQFLHPDERFVTYAVDNLRLPRSIGQYFDSASSPLNPRNFEWSNMWVYGTLPTTITRVVATAIGHTPAAQLVVVGRVLSGFFDMVACVALYFLGRRVYGRRAGLLAAALYAVTVMPIQQAHFFTTDNFAVAFATLSLLAAVRLADSGGWRDATLTGLAIGAAVACKINLAALVVVAFVAVLQVALHARSSGRPFLLRPALLLSLAGLATFASFRVLQPDAFTGPNLWDIQLEARFLGNLATVRGLVNGTVDMPPSHQWASRPPYLFALQNMVIWGMGWPLGLLSWAGFAAAAVVFFRSSISRMQREDAAPVRMEQHAPGEGKGVLRAGLWRSIIPWLWVALYFAWQGRGFNPSLRYFLPIYPPLIMFAAAMSLDMGTWLQNRALFRRRRYRWSLGRGQGWAILPAALLLAATVSWAWGFTRIYTRPHTRIEAARWMLENAPHGSSYTWEVWDDPLPYTNGNLTDCDPFCLIETHPYAEDEPVKFFGDPESAHERDPFSGEVEVDDGLIGQIGRADYIVLSSARVYSSVARLPHRYPATLRYYRSLFDGSLGYDLVAQFNSFPSLLGMPVPDLGAEEQFTVYDHPRVLIFQRTERFNAEAARERITGGIVWSEIYRISALTTSHAPTALRLTEAAWSRLQHADARYLFTPGLFGTAAEGLVPGSGYLLSVLGWLLLVELLGLAAFGLIWRFRIPLPDHGLLSSRFVGLLFFAIPPALMSATGWASVGRTALGVWFGIVVGFGLRLLVAERQPIVAFARSWRRFFWAGQGLYLGTVGLALVLRSLSTEAGGGSLRFGLAQWTALLRSPVLPPPDPYFAGGQLMLPYAGLLPVATVGRFAGLLPSESFNLALATLLGLIVSLAVAVTMRSPFRRITHKRGRSLALPLLPGLLVLTPGFVAGPLRELTPLGLLSGGHISALAAMALAAGSLTLVRALASHRLFSACSSTQTAHEEPTNSRGGWTSLAVVMLFPVASLALLQAQDRWAFVAVFLASIALFTVTWRGRPSVRLRPALALAVLLLGALVLARPFLITSPRTVMLPEGLTPGALIASLALTLVPIAGYIQCVSRRIFGPVRTFAIATTYLGLVVLALAFGWSLLLLLLLTIMLLFWLLLEFQLRGAIRDHRRAPVIGFASAGLILAGAAHFVLLGRWAGDAYVLFGAAVLLLACGASLALHSLLTFPGRRWSAAPVFAAGLLLGALVVGLGEMQGSTALALNQSENVSVAPELAGAVEALVGDADGVAVIAAAPGPDVPAAVVASGLPSLIAAPEAEGVLRRILQPSVEAVIAGRERALADIYGSDAGEAGRQLAAYGVRYVLVGPDERLAFGSEAGTGLRELLARGDVEQIYQREGVTLYRYEVPPDARPFVAQRAALPIPSLKTTMLDRPLADLPVVDEYAWNSWIGDSAPRAIVVWLLLIEIIGLLALPISNRIFRRAADGGWSWSKLIGLLVWAYAVWLPVSLGWWIYAWWALAAGLVFLALLSWLALGAPGTLAAWRGVLAAAGVRQIRGGIFRSEALFLGIFGTWTLVRAGNPDLWQPWFGGEKPFEFGMLNSIVRSPVMPPPDPFFSGGVINYYYYGLFLVSVPIRATGIDPAVAFNLIIPLLFALVATGAATVVRELTGRWRWALLGVTMVTLIGPAGSVLRINGAKGLGAAVAALRPGLSGWGGRLGDWFWGPSRIIPQTINEFPFFSFLYADLHPHMIALPITILGVALATEQGRAESGRKQWPGLALAILVLGTLAVTNTWDAPTSALVLGGALVGRAWRRTSWSGGQGRRLRDIALAAILAAGLLAGGLLLFLPFFAEFRPMVGGLGRVRRHDTLLQFLAIYGASIYIAFTLLVGLAWAVGPRVARLWPRATARGRAVILPALVAVLLGAWVFVGYPATAQETASPGTSLLLPLILAVLVAVALFLGFVARLRDEEWIVLWLITVGLMVALGVQFVFVEDHLAGSDWERMNTVFKFGLQTWTLLALGAAAGLPLVLRILRRIGETAITIWFAPLLVLLVAGSTYPLIATPSRLAMRFQDRPGLTLDGLAFMRTGHYEHEGRSIELRWDAEAIRWLKDNLRGLPVVLQSEAEFYRTYGVRIAANTGFPTVLGRLHADEQRPAADVLRREADVRQIYDTADASVALQLLDKYDVEYVYVGPVEREFYNPQGQAKWDEMVGAGLELAYQNPGVQIYRVLANHVAPQEPLPEAPPLETAPEAQEMEDAPQAQPEDGVAAFGLATQYVQDGRLEEAAAVLTAASASNSEDVPLHQLLGDIQAQLGRADEAVAAWRTAMEASPTAGNTAKLGTGLLQLGRFDEAEQVLQQALELDPADPLIHFYLGQVYHRRNTSGDRERAVKEYQAFLDASESDAPFRDVAEQALRELGR